MASSTLPAGVVQQAERILAKWRRIRQHDKTWVFQGEWLRAGIVGYTAPDGERKTWETVERTARMGAVDGVDMIAMTRGSEEKICLVAIYRAPVNKVTIEFPAGLMSEGESVEDAAVREFREETGLSGRVESYGMEVYADPWKSNENSVMCKMLVAESDCAGRGNRTLNLDDNEYLEPIELPQEKLLEHLEGLHRTYGFAVEAKLYTFALGLHLGSMRKK